MYFLCYTIFIAAHNTLAKCSVCHDSSSTISFSLLSAVALCLGLFGSIFFVLLFLLVDCVAQQSRSKRVIIIYVPETFSQTIEFILQRR